MSSAFIRTCITEIFSRFSTTTRCFSSRRSKACVAAGLIAAKFNEEAIYMYGASSTEHRAHGGAFALQFEAMRWARDHGAVRYDLWGIPKVDPVSTSEDDMKRVAGTRGSDWRGLFKFKTGFGGEIVNLSANIGAALPPRPGAGRETVL